VRVIIDYLSITLRICAKIRLFRSTEVEFEYRMHWKKGTLSADWSSVLRATNSSVFHQSPWLSLGCEHVATDSPVALEYYHQNRKDSLHASLVVRRNFESENIFARSLNALSALVGSDKSEARFIRSEMGINSFCVV
jgi:hypothetical protein